MSSYFDQASRMVSEAFNAGYEERAARIVDQVAETYGDYLAHISKKLTPQEASGEKWAALKQRFIQITSHPAISETDRAMKLSMMIENLHDFAHAVGSAHLATRTGRPILDNPYLAAKDSDIVIQERKR